MVISEPVQICNFSLAVKPIDAFDGFGILPLAKTVAALKGKRTRRKLKQRFDSINADITVGSMEEECKNMRFESVISTPSQS